MTYSIVARDPGSGELGVAVQSHWFSVGSLCAFARPGVGAVATQSVVEPAYGPRTLDRLAGGEAPHEALDAQLARDELARMRQVGVVDAQGRLAVHTGDDCIACAGDETGAHWTCQANMMERETVPAAMSAAFESATGPLADRLMVALEAAEGEGGDVRGRQSAALLVVPAQGEAWETRFDLRVEDHREPLKELWRLVLLQRAYDMANEADELIASGRAEQAGRLYRQAAEAAPESDELLFWAGLALAQTGDVDAGVEAVLEAANVHPNWLLLLERLSPEFAPAGSEVLERVSRSGHRRR